ncbi:MAG: carboxylating nicotinate-nucleotide diphosphorylase [Deltaproteobacteria bacterium]
MMNNKNLDWARVMPLIDAALREDVGDGDITTNLIFPRGVRAGAFIMAKDFGTAAGVAVAEAVFKKLDAEIRWTPRKSDGDPLAPNEIIAEIEGEAVAILTGERVALNLLQRLCGVATLTSKFTLAVSGLRTKILDTRKTAPAMRALDKYAVAVGGGTNHRFGLYDGILIKDNHIKLAGGISAAVEAIRRGLIKNLPIEVEASTLEEVQEALALGVEIIMLDNMNADRIRQALGIIGGKAITEASGGITLENVRQIAETGVDFISVGALTHSAKALDIGLYMV